ncbi:MAG: hypothetical protein ACXV7F_07210 [Methylomonas sp.]
MDSQSIIYKIAAITQIIAVASGLVFMLFAVFSEKTNQHDLMLLSGPTVGFLFFLVAVSSVVKSFSKK